MNEELRRTRAALEQAERVVFEQRVEGASGYFLKGVVTCFKKHAHVGGPCREMLRTIKHVPGRFQGGVLFSCDREFSTDSIFFSSASDAWCAADERQYVEERRRAEMEALRDKLVQSERKNTEVTGTFN